MISNNLLSASLIPKSVLCRPTGGEYQGLHSFFKQIGIAHQVSCPHAHQQNGSAERKQRHIVDVGLSLLSQASMPLKFWDKAFLTVVFLINQIPSKVIDFDTPIVRLQGKAPDYSFLRVFGCAVWPNLRPYNTLKLQFCSKRCVFIGYNNLHKGFKCLNPSDGRVYISRDVVFDEIVFPFSELRPNVVLVYMLRSFYCLITVVILLVLGMQLYKIIIRILLLLIVLCPSHDVQVPGSNGAQNGGVFDVSPSYFMCAPAGSSAEAKGDSPASGGGPDSPSSSGSASPALAVGGGFPVVGSSADATTLPHDQRHLWLRRLILLEILQLLLDPVRRMLV